MATEDDYFMVIIKKETETIDNDTIQIKEEYLDEDYLQDPSTIESILEQAALYGEQIHVKDEPIEVEYLSDDSHTWEPKPKKKSKKKEVGRPRKYVTKKMVQENSETYGDNSFVSLLKKSNPKLANDEEALVTELAKIMIKTRAPSPPPGAYTIIGENEYSCSECGDVKHTQPAIKRHYQEKHGPRFFRCYSCTANFRSLMNLYRHERVCHGRERGAVLRARARAVLKARPSRPFFSKQLVMRRAMRSAGKLQPLKGDLPKRRFACRECPARYSSRASLRAHLQLHRGVRAHVCRLCGAAYYHKTSLIKHSFKHSNTKFVCDTCGREFRQKYSIIAHLDTHLPVKKHACPWAGCERRFSTALAQRLHHRRAHLQLPPPAACRLCERRFDRMSLLKTHMKNAHGMMLMTRNMFFKSLPKLSDSEVLQAQVILRQEDPADDMAL